MPDKSNVVDLNSFDSSVFRVPASDAKGHSISKSFRVMPVLSNAMSVMLNSRAFPYKKESELIRHALVRHIKWLESIGDVPSVSGEVEAMAEIGVILLLFAIGLEFSLKKLMKIKLIVLIGGSIQVGLTIATVYLFTKGFKDWGSSEALFMGFLISLSSTAIVLKVYQDRSVIELPSGRSPWFRCPTALGLFLVDAEAFKVTACHLVL